MRAAPSCVILALLLTGCGKTADKPRNGADQKIHIEHGPLGTSLEVIAQQENPAALIIGCHNGIADDLMMNFVEEPSSPPPLAGVYGNLAVSSLAAKRIEMSYVTGGIWSPRGADEDDRTEIMYVIARFLEGESISFEGDGTHMPSRRFVWSPPKNFNVPECKPWSASISKDQPATPPRTQEAEGR